MMAAALDQNKRNVQDTLGLARDGDVEAQYEMGHLYRKGIAIRPNLDQAFIWYLNAAEKQHEKAVKALSRSPVELVEHEERADIIARSMTLWTAYATAGDPDAQFRLGMEYMRGEWVIYNRKESVYWLHKAAQQNHELAQNIWEKISRATDLGLAVRITFPAIEE